MTMSLADVWLRRRDANLADAIVSVSRRVEVSDNCCDDELLSEEDLCSMVLLAVYGGGGSGLQAMKGLSKKSRLDQSRARG